MLLREDCELLESEDLGTTALNVKGIGQLASSAIILGALKQALRNMYEFLVYDKVGLTNCQATQLLLSQCTNKIYSLEALLYLTASMYDAFETGSDCHLEALTVKTFATTYAHEIIQIFQSIYGTRCLLTSSIHDLINVFDSFLDGAIHNRMYLAVRGVKTTGAWKHGLIRRLRLAPFYPVYTIKYFIRQMRNRRDSVPLTMDFPGHLHPTLKSPGEWLEYTLKRLEYGVEILFFRHGQVRHLKEIAERKLNQLFFYRT